MTGALVHVAVNLGLMAAAMWLHWSYEQLRDKS